MRLLKLDERVQQMIVDDMISTGHARTLLAIENHEEQYNLANKIFDEKLSVRETEKLIKELKNPKKEKEKKVVENDFIYKDLEEKMKTVMGTTRQNKISRLIQKELSEIFLLQTKAMNGVLV